MEKKLYFDIIAKEDAIVKIDKFKLREELWPAYVYNICITDNVIDSFYDVKIKARVMGDGHIINEASSAVTDCELVAAGSLTDAIDLIMEELLNRMNKIQNTAFSRHVSCIGYAGPAIKQHFIFPPELLEKRYRIPELKKVHSSGPVSVAIWSNGKKSMVRKQKGDKSDPEKGILYAVIKGLCYENGGTKEYSRVLDMIHEALEERKNG